MQNLSPVGPLGEGFFTFRNGSAHPERRPVALDLFCGAGGLSLGFLMAGYRVALAADSDPNAVACYNANLKGSCDAGAVAYDLASLKSHTDIRAFLKRHAPDLKQCEVVFGGPPCQGFALVGRNKMKALLRDAETEAERRRLKERDRMRCALFESYALFIEVLQPDWFLFENVPSIRSHKSFSAIQARFGNLRAGGGRRLEYDIHWGIFTAADFGVPQERRRFILIGKRKNHPGKWVEPPTRTGLTVADAIGDLPRVPAGHASRELVYGLAQSSGYQQLMRSGWLEGETKGFYDHVCRNHQDDDIQLFRKMKQGERFADESVQRTLREINPKHHLVKYSTKDFVDKLHKLDNHRSAWTVTAHLQKDSYKFIHPSQGRTISVREAARLQSFPDWFRFSDMGMCTAFRLIGNAVPPLMAFAFATQIASATCPQ